MSVCFQEFTQSGTNQTLAAAAAAAAKSLQSCPTLCDPIDGSPPGSPSLGFSRQEHCSGLPFPSPGDLPHPGIEPRSPALQADAFEEGALKLRSAG